VLFLTTLGRPTQLQLQEILPDRDGIFLIGKELFDCAWLGSVDSDVDLNRTIGLVDK
jgi:hypothetical protein